MSSSEVYPYTEHEGYQLELEHTGGEESLRRVFGNAKCVDAWDVAAMTGRVPQSSAAGLFLPAASEH